MKARWLVICSFAACLSAAIAGAAYVVLLPRIVTSGVALAMTGCTVASERCAPLGAFSHKRRLPTASDHAMPYPNRDALASSAWIDVGDRPAVLHVPDMGKRFYSFQFLDAWTDVFGNIRRGQDGAGDYLIAGPTWKGEKPVGVKAVFRSSTNTVWILARVLIADERDIDAIIALQDQFVLKTFSEE